MNIKPDTYDIRKILNSGPYIVPRFQRPYSWQNEQLSDLYDDILNRITIDDLNDPLYLGAFVFNNENKKTTNKLDIIDGQQRLITISLIFVAIRDVCKLYKFDDLKLGVQSNFIESKDDKNRAYYRVIFHTDEQNEFYHKYFLQIDNAKITKKDTVNSEQKNLLEAYKFFYDKIKERVREFKANEDRERFLEKFKEIVSQILAVSIEVDSEEVAYQVFETLNSKGLRLSQIDLLKNLILQKYKPENQLDIARRKWDEEIIKALDKNKLLPDRFVRYYWLSKYYFISGKYLYKSIKNEITDFKEFLNELVDECKNYIEINNPSDEDFSSNENMLIILDSLKLIKELNIQQCYTLILSVYRAYRLKKISIAQLRSTIKLIENFSFIFKTSGKSPSGIERIFSKFAILTENAKDGNEFRVKVYKELLKAFRKKKPEYQEFEPSFIELNYYEQKNLCLLILYRINKEENRQNNLSLANFSIEHILPERPDPCWNLTENDIVEFVNLIGNLSLLEKDLNAKVGNKCIESKIKSYKKSEFKMTNKLKNNIINWKPETIFDNINNRSKELANTAYNIVWKI
ncbi:MAG TPA: DUF262 domain-containing HNH endonuclease family protein [Ignavibacteria bacterium]